MDQTPSFGRGSTPCLEGFCDRIYPGAGGGGGFRVRVRGTQRTGEEGVQLISGDGSGSAGPGFVGRRACPKSCMVVPCVSELLRQIPLEVFVAWPQRGPWRGEDGARED